MEMGLTHKDLAKALGVSETTIKSYRRKFPACIPVASNGKPIRFAPEAEAVCRRIQELFALGMAVDDVRIRLAEEFSWIEAVALEAESVATGSGATEGVSAECVPNEQKKALFDEAALLKEALQHSSRSPLASEPSQSILQTSEPVPSATHLQQPSPLVCVEQNNVSQAANDHKTATETGPRSTPYTTLPPEVRAAISDMARTVVELTLQQKKLLKQVEQLESRLDRALETIACMQESAAANIATSSQVLCAKTPIHEQIQINNNQNNVSISQDVPSLSETEQGKSRNPLLKIFGLERHG